jgi:hypothetical protein
MRGGVGARARLGSWRGCLYGNSESAIDPFQNLLAPALFDCPREETRPISNVRRPSAGGHAEFYKGRSLRLLSGGGGESWTKRASERECIARN